MKNAWLERIEAPGETKPADKRGDWAGLLRKEAPPNYPRLYWFFVALEILTAITWLDAVAEFYVGIDADPFRTDDPIRLAHIYLTFLAAYAGAKQFDKGARGRGVSEEDARLIKGEFFLVLWGLTAALMCVARQWYPDIYMLPRDFGLIIKGVFAIFLGGKGIGWLTGNKIDELPLPATVDPRTPPAPSDTLEPDADHLGTSDREALRGKILGFLEGKSEGCTRLEIVRGTGIGREAARLALADLIAAGKVARVAAYFGDPHTRYKLAE